MGKEKLNRNRSKRKKLERGISIPLTLAMIIFLAVATSASISGFERLKDFCLSRTYIKEIAVKGNSRISSEDILSAARLRVGVDSIRYIMPHILEKRIKSQSRYLERVSVQHKLAREQKAGLGAWLTIEVEEREPLALVKSEIDDDYFIVIDDQGFILEEVKSGSMPACISPDEKIPVIIGVDADILENVGQSEAGTSDTLAHPASDLALKVLVDARSMFPELFDQISCVDARNPDDIVLYLQQKERSRDLKAGGSVFDAWGSEAGTAIRLASDGIKDGLSSILPVIMKRRAENKKTKYMDARFFGVVYCGEGNHNEGRWPSG